MTKDWTGFTFFFPTTNNNNVIKYFVILTWITMERMTVINTKKKQFAIQRDAFRE